ncbi:ethylbenzene dehydrogenase-related protein [Azoarcus sp. DN11]|uniref:ethylbenzene dehydrogenase-related protein n=1 Tax=Azoarcus sp. DN11 TaxID=356837 RepID=UPI000EB10A37|nr:ethylbenzene dehydrogenase-related protein [Azoarcus sp. DN11]AYH43516.1 hypothetical protein CDA09_08995 [Azoarcus sp. DN11]
MLAKRVGTQRVQLLDVDASLWEGAAEKVGLIPAPAAMQPSKYIQGKWKDGDFGATSEVGCRARHNGTEVAFRLDWACSSPRMTRLDNDDFADGAALLFPLSKNASLIMGSDNRPVNMWHWRADRPQAARSNVAVGIGTSRVVDPVSVVVNAQHRNGRWSVVFVRSMAGGPDAAPFVAGSDVNVAFAVWQGHARERGGLKAFSPQWLSVRLEA